GIGMDPRLCSKVFDVFVQGGVAIDRSRGGLGLGLAVVRQLVVAHGGTVTATSDGPGTGSRFVVELPRTSRPKDQPEPAPAPASARPLRIVIVEDNEDAREILVTALEQRTHEVISAADGDEGLAKILAERPDVALIDIGLPKRDGYDIVRTVRSTMKGDTPPRLVAMTGYGQPEDKARAYDAGFDEHLVKPLSLDRVHAILAQVTKRP
ncbi:MAG TPA: response regulator, partial [Kofleriaceae bacterium]|nr:response regulator [Kofleriaceae bacterium]